MEQRKVDRFYQTEFRTPDSEPGVIEGRPIVFESRTDIGGMFSETIEKGALDGANLKDVLFFVNHDTNKIPLARSRNNNENSTLQLMVDDQGLRFKTKLDIEHNPEAAALYSAIQRRDITGMSFGFRVAEDKWENIESEYPSRSIKKIEMVQEISACSFPAYEATSIYTRSLDSDRTMLDSMRGELVDTKAKADAIEKMRLRNQLLSKLGGLN